jgi:hypothetical protein
LPKEKVKNGDVPTESQKSGPQKKSQILGDSLKYDRDILEGKLEPQQSDVEFSMLSKDRSDLCSACSYLPLDKLGLQYYKPSESATGVVYSTELGSLFLSRRFPEVLQTAKSQPCLFCAILVHTSLKFIQTSLDEFLDLKTTDSGVKYFEAESVTGKPEDFNVRKFVEKKFCDIQYVYRISSLEERSDQFNPPRATLNRLIVETRKHNGGTKSSGKFLGTIRFQSCNSEPATVHGQCDSGILFSRDIGESLPYGGRFRVNLIDDRLVRTWKDYCLNNHGHLCSTHNIVTPKPRIRLIDVGKRCIVNGSGTENWVALSYVWGGANTVLTTTENIIQHETRGSLEGILPPTIEDALRVTQALGERYLWVDCLCILQDCEEDKSIHLPRMGDIYRHAVVTIVAASGSNAAAGLPGIRNSITRSEQLFIQFGPPFKLGDYGVATMMDPTDSRDCDYAAGSPWSMRAWTFQERLLSRRVLIFTKDLVYWECEQAIWREDCFGELPAEFPQIFTSGFGNDTFWSHIELSRLWKSHPFDIVNTYQQIVSHYTGLQLTYQEDGLNAISGVLTALEMRSGFKFLWGLPTAMLSAALTWESHSDYDDAILSSRNQRRTAKHILGPTQNSISHCPFPSWSWVGWIGKVWIRLDSRQSSPIFFTYSESKHTQLIEVKSHSESKVQPFWTRSGWEVTGDTVIRNEHVPDGVGVTVSLNCILAFWTDVAEVLIRWQDTDVTWISYHEESKVKAEICQEEVKMMSTWGQIPIDVESLSSTDGSLVVIGTNSCYVNVLLVSWTDGIAYRRGIASVKESDWIRLRRRVWKPVFLA